MRPIEAENDAILTHRTLQPDCGIAAIKRRGADEFVQSVNSTCVGGGADNQFAATEKHLVRISGKRGKSSVSRGVRNAAQSRVVAVIENQLSTPIDEDLGDISAHLGEIQPAIPLHDDAALADHEILRGVDRHVQDIGDVQVFVAVLLDVSELRD